MKKLLIILLFLPFFGYSQNMPGAWQRGTVDELRNDYARFLSQNIDSLVERTWTIDTLLAYFQDSISGGASIDSAGVAAFGFVAGSQYINVKSFGAVGDGVTDDTEEIQEALDSAIAKNKILYFDEGTYLISDNGIIIRNGSNLEIMGESGKTIIKKGSGTSNMLYDNSTYSGHITIRNIEFDMNDVASFGLIMQNSEEVNIDNCVFKNGSGIYLARVTNGRISKCQFLYNGDFLYNAISLQKGVKNLIIKDNKILYANNGIIISGISDYVSSNIDISNNYIDMGWISGASEYTGTATYTSSSLTDAGASFSSISSGTTIRILDTLSTGTGDFSELYRLKDASATFLVDGVQEADLVRVGDVYGLVSQVNRDSVLFVEEWIDSTTRLPVDAPSGDYVVYQLNFAEVTTHTGTTINVTRFWKKDGATFTPSSNDIYEVLYEHGNYALQIEDWCRNINIYDNTVKRGWSDQIAIQGDHMHVFNNTIEWGQDMGITSNGDECSIYGNIVRNQGAGGIWLSGKKANISNNISLNSTWENIVNTTGLGGIMLSGADSSIVSGNTIHSLTTLGKHSIVVNGVANNNFITGNYLLDSISIQLYEGDSTVIGENYQNNVNIVSATSTQYAEKSIFETNGVVTGDRLVDLDSNLLTIGGVWNGVYGTSENGGFNIQKENNATIIMSGYRASDGGVFRVQNTSGFASTTVSYIESVVLGNIPSLIINKRNTTTSSQLMFRDDNSNKAGIGLYESGGITDFRLGVGTIASSKGIKMDWNHTVDMTFDGDSVVFTGDVTVPADAYDSDWDNNLTVPTKDAIWDKDANRAYGEFYVDDTDPDTVTITSGTPAKNSDTTVGETNDFTHTGGRLTYNGTTTKKFAVNTSISFTHDTNNTMCEVWVYKNGTELGKSELHRKIGTGGDVGNAGQTCLIELATNDYVEIFFDADNSGDVIIENMNVNISEI